MTTRIFALAIAVAAAASFLGAPARVNAQQKTADSLRAALSSGTTLLPGVFAGGIGMLTSALFGTLFIRGVQETFVLIIAAGTGLLHNSRRGAPEGTHAVAVPL